MFARECPEEFKVECDLRRLRHKTTKINRQRAGKAMIEAFTDEKEGTFCCTAVLWAAEVGITRFPHRKILVIYECLMLSH